MKDHDQIIANQLAGMSMEEAIFQAGYTSGHNAGYDRGTRDVQSGKQGTVWVKGQYEQLYAQVKAGKRVACYVDHSPWGSNKTFRDICTIDIRMEFASRGYCYGSLTDPAYSGTGVERFIQMCENLNVEWVNG